MQVRIEVTLRVNIDQGLTLKSAYRSRINHISGNRIIKRCVQHPVVWVSSVCSRRITPIRMHDSIDDPKTDAECKENTGRNNEHAELL
jgi:DUF1365 family protein